MFYIPKIYISVFCFLTFLFPQSATTAELHDAVNARDIVWVKDLLDSGVDIEESNFVMGTALHVAIAQGDTALVELLIDRNADIEAVSELQGARALHLAVEFKELAITEILLIHGANPNARDGEQRTALYRAASDGNDDIVELLLNSEASVDVGEGVFNGTPLQIATDNGQFETVKLLLSQGANINAIDNRGFSALSLASQPQSFRNVGDGSLIEFLVSQGADLHVKNARGQTPLEYAELRHVGDWSEIAEVFRRLEKRE